MTLDYSHRGADEGPWLPDYEPKGEHLRLCAVWQSDDPCDCKKATTADLLDRIDQDREPT